MGLIRRKNSSCKTKSLFLKQMQATSLEKNCPRAVCTGLQQTVRIKFGPNTDAHRTQFQKGHKLLSFNAQVELAAKTAWVSLQSLNIPDLINCHKTYHFSTQLHIFHYWKCFLRIPVCSIQDFFFYKLAQVRQRAYPAPGRYHLQHQYAALPTWGLHCVVPSRAFFPPKNGQYHLRMPH